MLQTERGCREGGKDAAGMVPTRQEGDSGERRGPLAATTTLWGHSEPLCSAGCFQTGCSKGAAAPVAAAGQSHAGTHPVPGTVVTVAESNQDPQERPVSQ